MDALRQLFQRHFGVGPKMVSAVQGGLGGSERRILRLTNDELSAIGVLHDDREENAVFLSFSRHFRNIGLPVPAIYAEDLARNAYLMQDLGDTTLYQFLQADRAGPEIGENAREAYRKAVKTLPRFQIEGGRGLDYSVCYPRAAFDAQSIAWDLNYFKYYFLRLSGTPFNEQALQQDFDRLASFLLEAPRDYFLYRDFQSRNIMLVDGEPYFLDYQGGRRGALQYDIASILYDAKADLPHNFREELLHYYLEELSRHIEIDRAAFLRYFYPYAYIRILQALGAYGFRGHYERKPLFLQSVPYALNNLLWILDRAELPLELPALNASCRALIAANAAQPTAEPARPLHISITSFSFHQGLPRDISGHGGGYVFDLRSLPNPGREPQFRQLTGRDSPVIEYLNASPAVRAYFDHVSGLVDASIAAYQRREFEHLAVSFGCTGGQHRSVYFAQKLASYLQGRTGVQVSVLHRELERLK